MEPGETVAGTQEKDRKDVVLLADDNPDTRNYLIRLLSERWKVLVAGDGEEALALARTHQPDIILSDVTMPKMDGVTLLKELRADLTTKNIPLILVSAHSGEESILEGLGAGADDYLVKPFSARELIARVRTHLEMARFRREWARELEQANRELEAFSYSVSHDLRAPLRTITSFSKLVLEEHAANLPPEGRDYLERVHSGALRMAQLVDDLLSLSHISRTPMARGPVDLTEIARKVLSDLKERDPKRNVETVIAEDLAAKGDARLVSVLLDNLLGNAWKYTSKQEQARIEMGKEQREGETVFWIRDNGAGFDMKHAEKLFAPFQRLHTAAEFEGTGIGLATVQRIITRHGGRVWAEASIGLGASFFFTLGNEKS